MEQIRYGRKKNAIRKALMEKVEEWLATIKDEGVQRMARKNTIITGGSIASMLLGDKVNDYDIYFRDKETTVAVAKYYTDVFNANNQITVGDVNDTEGRIRTGIPTVISQTKKNCKGKEEDRVCIMIKSSGVASESQTTYQYFEQRPEEEQDKFMESLVNPNLHEEEDKGALYRPVFLSQNAITLSHKMQIVIRFYGEPEKIHDNYDFAHAMNYYDHGSHKLVLKQEALECLLSRTLLYRGSLYPIASIFRVKKFIDRGWRVSAGQLLKIMWQISELDLTSYETLQDQLTGVDQAYLYQLCAALKCVDPEMIDSTYVASIIDKIFGEHDGYSDETDSDL